MEGSSFVTYLPVEQDDESPQSRTKAGGWVGGLCYEDASFPQTGNEVVNQYFYSSLQAEAQMIEGTTITPFF